MKKREVESFKGEHSAESDFSNFTPHFSVFLMEAGE